MTTSQTRERQKRNPLDPGVITTVLLAWLVPGLGHLVHKKHLRAIIYFVSLTALCTAGILLHGTLFSILRMNAGDGFLQLLAAAGNLGLGAGHFIMHWLGLGYDQPAIRTNEYGTTFLIVAALLNILITLNAFDIATGEKE